MGYNLINEAVKDVATRIFRHTVQLFRIRKGIDELDPTELVSPEPVASGILIEVQGQYFFVTAAHVFENPARADTGFIINNEIHVLIGNLISIDTSADSMSDNIDVAILQLESETVEILITAFAFLPATGIAFDHVIKKPQKYLIIGFPHKATKIDQKSRKIIPRPFLLLTEEADEKNYARYEYNPLVNGIFKFSQKNAYKIGSKQKIIHGSPQGISGCGIWHLTANTFTPQILDYHLIGIMIEQNDEKTLLIGTRIHIITEMLRQHFQLSIRKSNILRKAS